ncbi:Domain of uncharacterised function (DUF2825) [Klebsiella pneumoniae]|nr:Domain of uncharacterised function (DUF2825) [Klebsiella pneumoniae]
MSVKPGLSPLARGTQVLFARITSGARFIPAGAGNTSGAPAVHGCDTVYPRSAVYPRWRGEHTLRHCCGCSHTGLSPLARGTRFRPGSSDPRGRFIPAGAGNTVLVGQQVLLAAVYPRWRGEHLIARCMGGGYDGLSPLARGTHTLNLNLLIEIRFIPAGAGNTGAAVRTASAKPVYPRWRGEH